MITLSIVFEMMQDFGDESCFHCKRCYSPVKCPITISVFALRILDGNDVEVECHPCPCIDLRNIWFKTVRRVQGI